MKELSEELAFVQEELDQQKRLNETLVRRKVHELHLFVYGRCRRMTYLYHPPLFHYHCPVFVASV